MALTFIDNLSGYAGFKPLKKKSWNHVQEAIFAHWIFYFGHLKVIHTDNGIFSTAGRTEFLSNGTQDVESAPRDAAYNRYVERVHEFLSKQVKVFLTGKTYFTFNTWSLLFQELDHELNCSWNRMLNKTPFEATFGGASPRILEECWQAPLFSDEICLDVALNALCLSNHSFDSKHAVARIVLSQGHMFGYLNILERSFRYFFLDNFCFRIKKNNE